MNEEKLLNELYTICNIYRLYPEMLIEFRSHAVNGNIDIKEVESIKLIVDGCLNKLDELKNTVELYGITGMKSDDGEFITEALDITRAVIKMGSEDIDEIIDLTKQMLVA